MEGKCIETTTNLRSEASVELNKGDVASADATNTLPCNYSDIRVIMVIKMLEFSTKRPEDVKEVYITGILALLNKFIIVDRDNKKTEIILGKWRIFVVNKFDEIYIWNYSSGVKRNYSSGLLR